MRKAQLRTRGHGVGPALASLCVLAFTLPACTKQTPVAPTEVAQPDTDSRRASESANELNWARDALKRNPTIEILATDTSAGVFTIRSKDTGEVRAVKVGELAAVPVAALTAPVRNAATQETTPAREPAVAQPAAAPSTTSSPATASTAQPAASAPSYTIERADGQVKVSGPGVSIVSTGTTAVSAAGNATGRRSVEPIICEGRRMLHFDNRDIYVDGDAIVARGGCELYITNSRVAASGTGVIVNDATVHIANSTIEGDAASFDASDDAKVYVRSSTFQGLPRRAERAVVQDQGGNQWR